MKKFSSLTFQLFGFLALGLLNIGTVLAVFFFHNIQSRDFLSQTSGQTVFLNQIKEAHYHFNFARKEEKNFFLFRHPSYLQSLSKSLSRAQNLVGDLQKMAKTPEQTEILESLESHFLHYSALTQKLPSLETPKQIAVFTTKVKDIEADITEQVSQLSNLLLAELNWRQTTMMQITRDVFRNMVFLLALGILAYAGLGAIWLYRFRRRLKRLVHAAQGMAIGDYSPGLDTSAGDEIGILAGHFNEMAAKVSEREEKINQITRELIQANNLLKKGNPSLVHPIGTKVKPTL